MWLPLFAIYKLATANGNCVQVSLNLEGGGVIGYYGSSTCKGYDVIPGRHHGYLATANANCVQVRVINARGLWKSQLIGNLFFSPLVGFGNYQR